jgi:DNA-binding NarL/FixJ family response regulator
MGDDSPLRVVLIDDHEMVAEALALALRASGIDVVARAGSLVDGLPLVPANEPDVVLLDFRLPDGDAIDGVRALAASARATATVPVPVLVVTAVADERTAIDVLTAGAAGYVTKDLPIADLVDALRTAAGGGTVVPPGLLGAVMGRLRAPSGPASVGALTAREQEALALLAAGSGIDEIADAFTVSRNTARKHVQAVLMKLGAHSQLEAVAIARREGLLRP